MIEYLKVEDIARLVGVNEKTVRNYITSGELKASKLGTVWRIHPNDLQAFMDSKSNKPNQKGDY